MNDIKNALAQLRAARGADELSAEPDRTAGATLPETQPPLAVTADVSGQELSAPVEPETASRGEVKTLAGRVPLTLHRELTRALLDAADELRFSRINVDEALEAAVRVVLRDPQATALWYAQLREVRKERRES